MLQSLQSGLSTFFSYLPQLLGAIVVLVVGFIIAYILRKIVAKILQKANLDGRLTSGSGGQYVERFSPQGSPSALVGKVLFWVIMLFVITSAIGTLGLPPLTAFMNVVLSYLPNVIAALIIFLVAAAVAGAIGGAIGGAVHKTMGDTPTGRIVRTAAPALVMAIAVFMVLTQLGIAPVIVTATYIAIIFAAALASALAFGLGGRDAAAELINSGYRKAQEQSEQVKADVATGRDRGQAHAQEQTGQHSASEQTASQQTTSQQTTEMAPQNGDGPDGRTVGARRG